MSQNVNLDWEEEQPDINPHQNQRIVLKTRNLGMSRRDHFMWTGILTTIPGASEMLQAWIRVNAPAFERNIPILVRCVYLLEVAPRPLNIRQIEYVCELQTLTMVFKKMIQANLVEIKKYNKKGVLATYKLTDKGRDFLTHALQVYERLENGKRSRLKESYKMRFESRQGNKKAGQKPGF